MMYRILGTLLVLLLTIPALLPAQSADEADPLGIAAVLIRDGNYSRAETVLATIDAKAKTLDQVRYRTLLGLVALRATRYADAEQQFRLAKAAGQKDQTLDAYLAQALFAQQKYPETLGLLNQFARLNAFPDLLGMKSQCEWVGGDKAAAVVTLDRAIRNFPKQLNFLQTKIAYMLELNLTQEAASLAHEYLDKAGFNPSAWLTIGESLRRGRQTKDAIRILETARLAFPTQVRIKLSLSQAYLDLGLVRTAAGLLEEAGYSDAQYLAQAADLFKKAKDTERALYLNGLVTDTRLKARQRFSILVDAGRFEEALGLVPRLDQLGLLDEGKIRYAAAYASFRVQKFDQSQALMAPVADPGLFASTVQLRKAIESARAEKTLYF